MSQHCSCTLDCLLTWSVVCLHSRLNAARTGNGKVLSGNFASLEKDRPKKIFLQNLRKHLGKTIATLCSSTRSSSKNKTATFKSRKRRGSECECAGAEPAKGYSSKKKIPYASGANII